MSASPKKRTRGLEAGIVVVAVLAIVFGLRFHQLGRDTALASIRSVQESEGVPVETVAAARTDLSRWITLAGTVEGAVQYAVMSQNALTVVAIEVAEGQAVAAGDVVLRLAGGAPSPMFHSLDRARAGYENALREARRLRNLFAEGAVAQAQLDAAETALQVASVDLQDAEGSTALVAAEGGVVSSILIGEGETVPVNKPLVWIVGTGAVKLCFAAGSGQALSLAVGQQARWLLPDGTVGGEGTLSQLDLMADPKTHLLSGEAAFANPDGRLVPGLLVSFTVRTVHRPQALTVPKACLVPTPEGGDAVWTVTADRDGARAELRPVRLGEGDSDVVEVLAGLAAGEPVVRHGQGQLSPGLLVKLVAAAEGK